MTKVSDLKKKPKSQVLEKGYINIYSSLSQKEKSQVRFKTLFKEENPGWDESQVYLAKKFSQLKSNNLVVLDAGCGYGNYIIDENRNKIDWAVGIDASSQAASKNICLDEIHHTDLEKIPFQENCFDVCVSLWVFEHLEHPKAVFKEIHRVLTKSGYFMFATPNKNFVPLLLVRFFKSIRMNHFLNKLLYGRKPSDIFPSFYRANTIKDIRSMLGNGFEILELRYNYDPSYLSFGNFSYRLGNLFYKVTGFLGSNIMQAHIVGVVRKL